jgi:hypothetical protein
MKDAWEFCNERSRLMHWSSDTQKSSIIDEARYMTNYNGLECDAGAWAMYIADPTLSQCDNNLYALYTKYGDDNEPGALGDCSDGGFANGELYLAASDDGGFSWDTSGNITNSRTPGCAAGDCESDAWASMPPYGITYGDESVPDTLDAIYINDRDAGEIPYGYGDWSLNNVMHLRLACREVPHVPRVSTEPLIFGYENTVIVGDSLVRSVIINNIGNGTLHISDIRAEYYDSTDWIAFSAYSPNVPVQEAETLTVTFNTGAILPGYSLDVAAVYDADIVIVSDVTEYTIPVHFGVFDDPTNYQYCENMAATTKTLRVCNTGRLSNDYENASLNIPGDCDADLVYPDADLYLYDASPMITYHRNDSSFAYTSIWTQYPDQPGTFKPKTALTFTSVAGDKQYSMAVCTLVTTDSVFGVNMTVVAPTDGNDFVYVIYEYYPLVSPNDLDDVYVGVVADWDIPSDNNIKNSSGYDAESTPPMIWQRGAESSSVDEDPPHDCPILETDRYGGIVPLFGGVRNAWTAENFPMYSSTWGFNPDSLYNRMSGQTGYNMYSDVGADSITDLHTGITSARVDMSSGASYTTIVALVTTNEGLSDLYKQAAAAMDWTVDWPFQQLCHCLPGDADGSQSIDIGDAVYLINRIFKGGPPPTPYNPCSGDPNADCAVSIGDPVYIINYIFKGGPPPVDCDTWVQTCGSYEP